MMNEIPATRRAALLGCALVVGAAFGQIARRAAFWLAGAFFSSAFAGEPSPSPRIGPVLGEVKLPGGEVYQVASSIDFTWPNLEEAEKILRALAAAEPKFALFAHTFAPVPVQIVPLWENAPHSELYIRQSVAVGPYQLSIGVRAHAKPDLSALELYLKAWPANFGAYYVPPEIEKKSRVTLDDIGPSTPLKFDEMEEFCRAPEAYLRAHVPTDRRGQAPLVWGVHSSYYFQVRVSFDALKGACPVARDIVTPAYPNEMVRAGITGEVTFEATVQADGSVSDFAVVKASQSEFTKPVQEAVAAWKFRPSSSAFGARPEIMELFDRRVDSARPQRIRGTILFTRNED